MSRLFLATLIELGGLELKGSWLFMSFRWSEVVQHLLDQKTITRLTCRFLLCVLVGGLSACGGGSSSGGASSELQDDRVDDTLQSDEDNLNEPSIPEASSLKGQVTFERVPVNVTGLVYEEGRRDPARYILVQAVNQSGGVIASSLTDSKGQYELMVPENQSLAVRAMAQMDVASLWVQSLSDSERRWVLVEDNTADSARYAIQGSFATLAESAERLLHAPSGWTGSGYGASRQAAPFAILDTLYNALNTLGRANAPLSTAPIRVRWSKDNRAVSGDVTQGEIGTSHYNSEAGGLYILGAENSDTDEYDEHVILHEFAHCLEDRLGRLDSMGGAHSLSEPLDMRLAFSEGWATALSALFLEKPLYLDSQGTNQRRVGAVNVDNQQLGRTGWFNESTVQALFYDIGDSTSPDDDTVSLDLSALMSAYWETTQNLAPLMSSHPLLFALKQRHPSQANQLDQLYNNFEITADDLWGENETNSGGLSNTLPIYDVLTEVDAKRSCITRDSSANNKLGNRRLFRTSVDVSGAYDWRAEQKTGLSIGFSLTLFDQGNVVGFSSSGGVGRQILRANVFANRDYVLELKPSEGSAQGTWCFDVMISP